MPPHSIALTEEQDGFVEGLVASGRYRDADDVVREGLRLLAEREADDGSRLAELRAAAQDGLADLQQGRFSVFVHEAELRAHFEALAERASRGHTVTG